MIGRRLLARAVAVTATSVVVVSGLATVAQAAGTATVSGSPVLNDAPHTLTFTTSDAYPGSTGGQQPPAVPTVTLNRHGVAGDTLAGTNVTVGPNAAGPPPGTHTVTATFNFANVNPGQWDVTISGGPAAAQNPTVDTCTWGGGTSCVLVNAFRPTVGAVSPAALAEGTTPTAISGGTTKPGYQPFVITGQNFTKGPYTQCTSASTCVGPNVGVFKNGSSVADANVLLQPTWNTSNGNVGATPTTPTTITLNIVVSPNAADLTTYYDDVVVYNSDGTKATCAGCLQIDPQPVISSVALDNGVRSLGRNAVNQTLVVTGSHFPDDAAISFTNANAGAITFRQQGAPVDVGQGQQTITLTGVNTTGITKTTGWKVNLTSPSRHAVAVPFALPVTESPYGVDVTYSQNVAGTKQYGQGAKNVTLVVTLDNGAAIPGDDAGFREGQRDVPHTFVTFAGLPADVLAAGPYDQVAATSGGVHTVTVPISGISETASLASYDINAVNPDGGMSRFRCDNTPLGTDDATNTCFLTVSAGPKITGMAPSSVPASASNPSLRITGSNFDATNGVRVVLGKPNQSPLYSGVLTPTSSGTVLTIPAGSFTTPSSLDDYDLSVTNLGDKGSAAVASIFHTTSGLAVSGPTPQTDGHTNDDIYQVVITGTGFQSGAAVALQKPGVRTIVPTTTPTYTNSQITASFDFQNVAPGKYDIVVSNPPNSPQSFAGTATCGQCYTVQALAPSIQSITPNALGQGANNQTITVRGRHIFPGATIGFLSGGAADPKVHVIGSPTVTSNDYDHGADNGAADPGVDRLVAVVSIDGGTDAVHSDTLRIVNTDGNASGGASNFTVNPGPTVTALDTTSRAAGSNSFPLTVTGTGFVSGATLRFSDPQVGAAIMSVSATTIRAQVTPPPSVAAPEAVHVTVVNPDKGEATSPSDITFNPQPSIDRLAPAALAAGTSQVVQIIGTGFASGATVASPDSSLTVSNVRVVGPGEIDANVAVPADANRGGHPLRVTNADAGTATGSVSVFVKPGKPGGSDGVATVTPGDRQLQVSWDPATDDGGDPNGISSYTVTVTPHNGGSGAKSATITDGSTSRTFGGLKNGTLYDVSVVATNAAGNGSAATGSGTPATVPGAPTGVTATAGDGQVTVTWSAPASTGGSAITGYTVTYDDGTNPPQSQPAGPDASSATLTGLTNGATYQVQVIAHNAVGDSQPSESVVVRPKYVTAMTLTAPTSVRKGQKARLAGVLTHVSDAAGVSGASIYLFRKVAGAARYRLLTSSPLSTSSSGAWHFVTHPTKTAVYKAVFRGDTADRRAVAPVRTIKVHSR